MEKAQDARGPSLGIIAHTKRVGDNQPTVPLYLVNDVGLNYDIVMAEYITCVIMLTHRTLNI